MSGKLLPMKRARLEELESCSTGLSRQPETTMAYTKPYPYRQDAESFDARLIMANPYHRARQNEHQRKAFGLPCAPDENGVEADSFGRDQMPTPQAHQVRYQSCFDGAAGCSHAEADGAAALRLAGNVVGMVPLHTAQVVGGAVNAAATVATIAVSKARVAALLRGANSDVFGPRGLRVGVVGFRDVALLADDDIRTQSVQQRRLRALQPWLSPLDIDDHPAPSSTPSPTTTTSSSSSSSNPLSKMHAAASDRQRRKEEAKLLSSRRKAHDKWTSEQAKLAREHARETQKLDREEGRARGRDSEADLRRVQRRRRKWRGKL
ncbi:hypothetical protein ACCO45_013821 [Purpureocillium lilacinum]|uniref:Uncharacterized protein n=1 Tax=Purpureocillium lilacinum TaxID=33203 RepID=A0ACC4D8G3_PURLI